LFEITTQFDHLKLRIQCRSRKKRREKCRDLTCN